MDLSPELFAAINGGWGLPTKSGGQVSTTTALQQTAYLRGILVIAEGVAQLPVEIYRTLQGGGIEPAIDHPLYEVLRYRANVHQDAFQFWRTMLMHAAGAGDGVAYRVVVGGQVRELIPIRPECVSIDIRSRLYDRVYDLTFEKGNFASVGQDQVFHLAGPSWATHKALDPAVIGREAIGLAQSTEETHARLHANSARPSGTLQTEQRLDPQQIAALREGWRQAFSGVARTGETPVLAGGLKWESVAMKGVDAEHMATRKHQIEEIARLLGVFPIMLGHAGDQTPTFASADAFLEAHVRYTLQPWIKATIAAIETQLLTRDERREGYHVRIDSSELLRGSLKDRTEYYKAALGTNSSPGWLDPNEVREDDGWNPREGLSEVMSPLTMKPAGGADASTTGNAQPPDPAATAPETKASRPRTLYVERKLLNGDELVRWAKAQGFRKVTPAAELHVTIAFSRALIDWMTIPESWTFDGKGALTVPAGGPRVVEPIGPPGMVALKFASTELAWRHQAIREAGASWPWPDYQPHVTITDDAGALDLATVEPFRGELRFGPEIFAEINES